MKERPTLTVQDAKTIYTMCTKCYGPFHEGTCPEPNLVKPVIIDIRSLTEPSDPK